MKIIHCLNHFFPGQIAGTEVYTLSLIKELQKKNIECTVLIPNSRKNITEQYEVKGVRVIKYAEPSVADRELLMGKRKPDGLTAFTNVLKKEAPAIVHFHEFTSSNGITQHHISIAKEMGFKVVMTFHLSGYSCKTGNLMYKDESACDGIIDIKKCTRCVYSVKNIPFVKKEILLASAMLAYRFKFDFTRRGSKLGTAIGFPFIIQKLNDDLKQLAEDCDQLVVLTQWYKTILGKNGVALSKITHIAQGLPDNSAQQSSGTHSGEVMRLVFIGRISPVKGLHLLIEAMQDLPPDKITLDIYGEINDEAYTDGCKNSSSLLNNITWKGSIIPESVVTVLSGYDVLCLPSAFSEMSPLVIQEAFAAGIPVLASNVYGNAEQVCDNVNGWLFKFKNSADLNAKLVKLLQNRQLIETAKKNIPVVKVFSSVATEYEMLYKRILQQV